MQEPQIIPETMTGEFTAITSGENARAQNIVGNLGITAGGALDIRDSTINIGSQQYALQRHSLPVIEDLKPSDLSSLQYSLASKRLVTLQAPSYWRSTYVMEHLSQQMVLDKSLSRDAVFALTVDDTGRALLHELALRCKTEIQHTVIMVYEASPQKYPESVLVELQKIAGQSDLYLILLTDQMEGWSSHANLFMLEQHSPYTPDDYLQWLINKLNDEPTRDHLISIEVIPDMPDNEQIGAETRLQGIKMTVAELSQHLAAPGLIVQFTDGVFSAENQQQFVAHYVEIAARSDEPLQEWFDNLAEPEKYLVLAISLVDELPQETFWAIYEQLTQQAWRERVLQLSMRDYLDIRQQLATYIQADERRVSFKDKQTRRTLIKYALKGYRRALVQALPTLANILTGAIHLAPQQRRGSVLGRLRELDIFGSELYRDAVFQERRRNLRNRLIDSIVQIAELEASTIEHLLLAWAEGAISIARNAPDAEIDLQLRFAFSETLFRMFRGEIQQQGATIWQQYPNSLGRLHRWYTNLQEQPAPISASLQARRRSIRQTIALTLSFMGVHLPAEIFFGSSVTRAHSWLQSPPDHQPSEGEIDTPYELLVALVLDPNEEVRKAVVGHLLNTLTDSEVAPAEFERLMFFLADDPSLTVQVITALGLWLLAEHSPLQTYFTTFLLEQDTPSPWQKISDNHYLKRQATHDLNHFPAYLKTGLLSLLLIGTLNKNRSSFEQQLLMTYIHKLLDDQNQKQAHLALVTLLEELGGVNSDFQKLIQDSLDQFLKARTWENRLSLAVEKVYQASDKGHPFLNQEQKDMIQYALNIPLYG